MRTMFLMVACSVLLTMNSVMAQKEAVAAKSFAGVSRVKLFNYPDCVELKNDSTRVVLGHHVGGRLLVYERGGKNVLYLSDGEADWTEGGNSKPTSAGRFDLGPELIQARGDAIWNGPWTAEMTGDRQAKMTSGVDPKSGMQVTREFRLAADSSRLTITQTAFNRSDTVVKQGYWSRTFAVHGGVAVIPCDSSRSRFPKLYYTAPSRPVADMNPQEEAVRRINDFLVVDGPTTRPKMGFDSVKGWVAYQTRQDQLFVKRFPVFPLGDYGEATSINFSLWYPGSGGCEIEPIGPLQTMRPGESASFTVDWWLLDRKFPSSGKVDPKSVARDVNEDCAIP